MQAELRSAHQATNEEKSLKMHLESKLRTLESNLQAQADDVKMLQTQVSGYQSMVEERTQEVSECFPWMISETVLFHTSLTRSDVI